MMDDDDVSIELPPDPERKHRRLEFDPPILEFVEAIGFRVALDWDETLQISVPDSLDPIEVGQWIGKYFGPNIRAGFLSQAKHAAQVFVGGPYAGKRHSGGGWGKIELWHRATAEWHAYIIDRDGRAQYAGQATSRPKAQQLARDRAWDVAKVWFHSPHSCSLGSRPNPSE